MRFAIALLAATSSALELPNYFFTDNAATDTYKARQWAVTTGSALNTRYLSSKFNNRFRMLRPLQAGDTVSHNINDSRGYDSNADILATGETNRDITQKFGEAGMSWFGGCYFKPSRQFEEYYNNLIAAGRHHIYANAADTNPTYAPDFRNKKLSGSVAYHCQDRDVATLTTYTVDCEVTAKARGYKWDVWNARQNIALRLWRPFIELDTTVAPNTNVGSTVTASSVTRDLDDNCLRQQQLATDGVTQVYPGLWDYKARNQYHYTIPVAGAADVYSYAQSNFIAKLVRTEDTLNIQGDLPTPRNLRYTDAWAVLDIDESNVNVGVNQGFDYAVVNSRAAAQTQTTHALEKAFVAGAGLTWPDNLDSLLDQPPLGCCKFEEWNKRTFMRTVEAITKEFERICKAERMYNFVVNPVTNDAAATTTITQKEGMRVCLTSADGTNDTLEVMVI